MRIFSKQNLPEHCKDGQWKHYHKKVLTEAIRIKGKFTVKTREGELECKNGYLALDRSGYPYPIEAKEFNKLYEIA